MLVGRKSPKMVIPPLPAKGATASAKAERFSSAGTFDNRGRLLPCELNRKANDVMFS
jgi:hypothetical protein